MERLIDKETAILAKKVGFLLYCDHYYVKYSSEIFHSHGIINNNVLGNIEYAAPTQTSVQKWLREEHGIWVSVQDMFSNGILISYNVMDYAHAGGLYPGKPMKYCSTDDYYNVLETGLYKALELLKTIQERNQL